MLGVKGLSCPLLKVLVALSTVVSPPPSDQIAVPPEARVPRTSSFFSELTAQELSDILGGIHSEDFDVEKLEGVTKAQTLVCLGLHCCYK